MKIRLENVEKTFGRFAAVRDVSLDIESGELLALLGPSGSGKTTILRMVAGLDYADAGHIYFGSEDATTIPVRDRGVGFVFQHYALFPHMTVSENIAFGMTVSKVKRARADIERRVSELLSLVKLDGLGQRFPGQISGGQRQRVALARALSVDPKVLLLDEPFGALDANVRRDLRRWLREIHDTLGITTIFVTHDQEEALDLADRVVILNQGKIVQQGAPKEVCRHPDDPFVMTFLGDATRISGVARDGAVYIDDYALPASSPVLDGRVDVYVRPADLTWAQDRGDIGDIARSTLGIPAQVTRIFDRPGDRRIVARTDRGEHLEFDVAPEDALEPGETGHVLIRRAKVFAA